MAALIAVMVCLAQAADATESPEVMVTPEITSLVLGETSEVRVSVTRSGAEGRIEAPRLSTNVGRVSPPRRTGERSFELTWTAPDTRFPQYAIIAAAWDEPVARNYAVVKLAAAVSPAFRTGPGDEVTVDVGTRRFGPAQASPTGEVRVPLVLPPGVATVRVRATDRRGKVTERNVDLRPPPFGRFLLIAPAALPAGTPTEVALVVLDDDGSPADEARVILRSSYLRPHPLGRRQGFGRYLVRAPARIEHGPVRLTARLRPPPTGDTEDDDRDDVDKLEVSLPLRPGPLARLEFVEQAGRLTVRGDDLFGHALPVDDVEIFVDGKAAQVDRQGAGPTVLVAPAIPEDRASNAIEAVKDGVYAHHRLPRPRRPARPPRPETTLVAAVGLGWVAGPGFGASARAEIDASSLMLPPSLRLGLAAGYLGTRLPTNDELGRARIALDRGWFLARGRWRHELTPRIDVAAAAGAGLAYTRLASQLYGLALVVHQAGLAGELAAEASLRQVGPGALTMSGRILHIPLRRTEAADVKGGETALVFDAGYRVRF